MSGLAQAKVGFWSQCIPTHEATAELSVPRAPVREFPIRRIVTANGQHRIVEVGRITRSLTGKPQCEERLSKYSKTTQHDPGEVLEAWFGQVKGVYDVVQSNCVWAYGLAFAERERLSPQDCRTLSRAIQRGLLVRAGVLSQIEAHNLEAEAA